MQHFGLFGLAEKLMRALVGDRWAAMVGSPGQLDRAVRLCYRRRARAVSCTLWQLLGWLAGSLEIWAALWALGHPVD